MECIAERLLEINGGATAIVTSTRNQNPYENHHFANELNRFFTSGQTMTLGEMVTKAKNKILISYHGEYPEVIYNNILIGDPGLILSGE